MQIKIRSSKPCTQVNQKSQTKGRALSYIIFHHGYSHYDNVNHYPSGALFVFSSGPHGHRSAHTGTEADPPPKPVFDRTYGEHSRISAEAHVMVEPVRGGAAETRRSQTVFRFDGKCVRASEEIRRKL